MADVPVLADYEGGKRDLDDLGILVSGAADRTNPGHDPGTVTTRLGATYPVIAKIIADLQGTDIQGPLAAALDGRLDLLEAVLIPLPPNPLNMSFAIVDDDGYVGLGLTADGRLIQPETELEAMFEVIPNNPYGYVFAVVDENGYVGFAIDNSGQFVSSQSSEAVTAPLPVNPFGYALALVDPQGYVGFAVTNDGRVVSLVDDTNDSSPISNPTAFVDGDGDLMMVSSYGPEPIPNDPGGVKYPQTVGGRYVEFVSDFLDGTDRKFRMALDGTCLTPEPGGVVNMILGYGQSNREGAYAPISTKVGYQPRLPEYNLMFNGGPNPGNRFQIDPYLPVDADDIASLVPLHEIAQILDFDTNPGGEVLHGETSNSSTAWALNTMIYQAVRTYQTILACDNGVSSTGIEGLKKGTIPYANMIACVTRAKVLALAAGQRLIVRAMHMVHGEGDATNVNYGARLTSLQSDAQTDIQTITGQDEPVHLFLSQHSAWNFVGNVAHQETNGLLSPFVMDDIADGNPVIHLVGPKYTLLYPISGDGIGLHLDGDSQDRLGLDFAKAHKKVVLDGEKWVPLRPINITRSGAIIDVQFAVPVEPLVLDTTLVSDPGNFGFEYTSSGSPPAIASVALKVGTTDTVRIILASDPGAAANKRLRYAFTSVPEAGGGRLTGPRGCLRDSDPTVAPWDEKLHAYNYCIHFNEPLS